MSVNQLPDFDLAVAISQDVLDSAALSESHGVVCGLLIQRHNAELVHFIGLLASLELVRQPAPDVQELLAELMATTLAHLNDEELGLQLWLPEDSQPLLLRTQALGHWCNGFLAALGAQSEQALQSLSDEGKEALTDVAQIAKADIGPPEGSEQIEEDEQAFAEIVEYLRIAVLILHEDLRRPLPADSIH